MASSVQSFSGGNLYLDLDDGHGQGEDFNDVTIAANSSLVGSWQHITGMFQTAPGTTGVKVRVVHASAASIVAYVDDITLEKELGELEAPQNGMIQEIRDQVNPSYSETYGYDNLYRLVQAETSVWTAAWSYDRYGNRLSQTTTGVSYSETLSISASTNRVNVWTYDAAGNVTNDGTHTYQYDAENRLIKIDGGSTAQYAYGPQGERVSKIAAGVTTYFYWGIGEKVGGQWTKLYVSGLGGKLVETSDGTAWFFATNHLGTIAARMNVGGQLMETYRYLPYGEPYAGTQTPHQYTGKERDAESGLDYFGARYYASAHGRWMSVDPSLGFSSNNPQRLNLYSFVLNNPVNSVDRGGRSEENWAGWELPGWEFQGCHWEEVLDRSSGGIFVCTYTRGASRLGETRQAREARGGGGAPESFKDERKQYDKCKTEAFGNKKTLGNKSLPTFGATREVLSASAATGVSAALIAVTWAGETNFARTPVSSDGDHVGPMQIGLGVWAMTPQVAGLDPFGTDVTKGQRFNGNVQDNLRTGTNILGYYADRYGLDAAAGYYRTGDGPFRDDPGNQATLQEREELWNTLKDSYGKFFDCMKENP